MKKLNVSKAWKIVGVVVLALVLLTLVFNLLIGPRLTRFILGLIPGASDVQTTFKKQFPQEKIGISEQISNTDGNKQHILLVSLAGNNFLDETQIVTAKTSLCSALGQRARYYSSIYLQNSISHEYLIFYYRNNQAPVQVKCS